MKLLFDFFPVLLFFIAFKLFNIFIATAIAIAASFAQVVYFWLRFQRLEKIQLISLVLITVFGGATLLFHDPWFIKWKPTAIYWLTAIAFLGSALFGKQTFIEKMMGNSIALPKAVWSRLNIAWVLFFLLMGCINLYVAHTFSTNAWVNFKLFGGTGITLIFVVIQAIFLSKHMTQQEKSINGLSHTTPGNKEAI